MERYQIRIIETIILAVFYLFTKRFFIKRISRKIEKNKFLEFRGKTIEQTLHIILTVICILILMIIWGVETSEVSIFVGSTLTFVGVAFFAQWSLLSNITSSVILFFSHPVRLNDMISIVEGKEYEIRGRVTKIGLLFITLRSEDDEDIIFPNNVFIQKSIKKVAQKNIQPPKKIIKPEF